jgi:hypothetical protein
MVLAGVTPPEWEISIIDENLGTPDYSALPRPDVVGIRRGHPSHRLSLLKRKNTQTIGPAFAIAHPAAAAVAWKCGRRFWNHTAPASDQTTKMTSKTAIVELFICCRVLVSLRPGVCPDT